MRTLVCIAGFVAVSLPVISVAQDAPDFSALRVSVGDKVYVTDTTTGVEVNGPLTALTPTVLTINGHTFAPAPGLMIQKAGDPIWDGALLGSGIGTLAGMTIGSEGCLRRSLWPCALQGAVSYGLVAALIDAAHKGRTRIYRSSSVPAASVRVVPLVEATQKGVGLALAF